MSGRVLSFEVVILCTSLASAACAPGTDESPLMSPSTASPTRGTAGGPATAGGAAHPAAGAPAPGATSVGTAGLGSIPSTGGLAGRGPLAGMPAAMGGAGRGPVPMGGAGIGAAGMGPIATNPAAGGGAPLGAAGMTGSAGGAATAGAGSMTSTNAAPEMGRLVGVTAAHNAVRAKVMTTPPLAQLTWSPTLAAYAQQWADSQAMSVCSKAQHRSGQELQQKGYGENLAKFGSSRSPASDAAKAVNAWASEVACWTYGSISAPGFGGGTEKCDTNCYMQLQSDGCGHYTAIVWRNTTEVGCGVATCNEGGIAWDIWFCNYAPAGNVVGQKPY
jgi:pathogenesis-related protein 1